MNARRVIIMLLAKSLLILIILLWLNRFNQVINLLNLKLVIDSELEYFDSIRIFLAKVELIKRNKKKHLYKRSNEIYKSK